MFHRSRFRKTYILWLYKIVFFRAKINLQKDEKCLKTHTHTKSMFITL